MERKAFLKTIGAGAAFALAFPCLHGCSSDSGNDDGENLPIPTGVDFTIDLNANTAVNLQNNGGFIFVKSKPTFKYTDIIVVRNLEGNLIAASQICSHQGDPNVEFLSENGGIYRCTSHQSRFSQVGTPLNSVSEGRPLKVFNTELLADNMLRIFE